MECKVTCFDRVLNMVEPLPTDVLFEAIEIINEYTFSDFLDFCVENGCFNDIQWGTLYDGIVMWEDLESTYWEEDLDKLHALYDKVGLTDDVFAKYHSTSKFELTEIVYHADGHIKMFEGRFRDVEQFSETYVYANISDFDAQTFKEGDVRVYAHPFAKLYNAYEYELCHFDKLELLKIKQLLLNKIKELNFINDSEKMADFYKLSKQDFLNSYSYLSELEYAATECISLNLI